MPGMNMMNNHPNPDDQEAAMARADLYKLANYSFKLFKMIRDGDQLEGWVQAKVTKAADYIASVYHYMEYEMKFSEYGSKLENSDVYTEDVKKQYLEKLNEAKAKLEKLKKKNEKEVDETFMPVKAPVKKGGMSQADAGTGEPKPKIEPFKGQSSKMAKDMNQPETNESVPQNPDGATAPPPKGKDGQYPVVTSGPHKGKRWSPQTPGPTNPAMKEALKGGQKKLDVDKDGKLEKSDFAKLRSTKKVKEEMKVGDTKKTRTGELTKTATGVTHKRTDFSDEEHGEPVSKVKQKSAAEKKADKSKDIKLPKHKGNTWGMKGGEKFGKKMEGAKPDFLDMDKDGDKKEPMKKAVKDKKVAEAAKCNHTAEGKSCPVHGMKECGSMYEASHQEKTTMKHVKNPTAGEKKAAKDIKPGVKGYSDRVAMLKSAEKDGRLGEAKNLKQQAAIAIAKKKANVKESAELDRMKQFLTRLNG